LTIPEYGRKNGRRFRKSRRLDIGTAAEPATPEMIGKRLIPRFDAEGEAERISAKVTERERKLDTTLQHLKQRVMQRRLH